MVNWALLRIMGGAVDSLLFKRADIRTLVMLRIAIGLWFFIDFSGMMLIGYVQEAYIDAQVHFPFYGFEWITPLPGWAMYVLFSIMAVAAVFIMFGYRYKLALFIFLIGQTYVFMLDIVYTLNKFYLFILLAGLLIFLPANRLISLDTRLKRVPYQEEVPRWMVLVFQFMIGLIYVYSGISKLTTDWLVLHQPLTNFLSWQWPFNALSTELREGVIALMTYGGLFFDLTIVIWLSFRKTRMFGHLYQVSFHLLNFFYLNVGSLSIFMIIITLILFPPQWIREKMRLRYYHDGFPLKAVKKRTVSWVLGMFALIMVLLPHRHYLIDNNVNWTEKGHRFSWRLMTRTKLGSHSTFIITDKATQQTWTISPKDYLTGRQYRKMSAETDLVIVFAHWLEDEWKAKGYEDLKITAVVSTKLNGRTAQLLIDPNLDLTEVERSVWRDEVSTELVD